MNIYKDIIRIQTLTTLTTIKKQKDREKKISGSSVFDRGCPFSTITWKLNR